MGLTMNSTSNVGPSLKQIFMSYVEPSMITPYASGASTPYAYLPLEFFC